MNKFSFINQLLQKEKFTASQKERVLKLVTKELTRVEGNEQHILNEIQLIKREIGLVDKFDIVKSENLTRDEKYVKEFSNTLKLIYKTIVNGKTDPRNASLDDKIKILSNIYDVNNAEISLMESINNKKANSNTAILEIVINRIYFLVAQKNVNEGLYEKIEISRDSYIIPEDVTKDLMERCQNVLKDEEEEDNLYELPTYFYPSSSYKFLFNYNQNRILKSTCHDIGSQELQVINNYCDTEEYDFIKHLEKIKEAYDVHEKKYFAPSFLKTRFRVYLTGKNYYGQSSKGWSEESIKINWSTSSLEEWSEKNPGIPPNLNDALTEKLENTGFEDFESFTSNISDVPVQSFTELVYHFKHSFHLNGDNPLRAIIERTNNLNNWNEQIDFIIENDTFPLNIEHFTDVDKLIQAYKSIIELIIEATNNHELERPKVRITSRVNSEEFQFSIHHLNSIYRKTINNTLERTGQHYRNLIENQVNGLCNLILKAEFESDPKSQINIWDGKERKPDSIKDENFKGVEHIFLFPKK